MIDYQQEQGRLEPPGIPDDITFLGNILQKMLNELRLASAPAPTTIPLNPGVTLQTTARFRGMFLLFSGGVANDVMAIKIGAATEFVWVTPAQPTIVPIPCPVVFPSGQDVSIVNLTNSGNVAWRCTLFATVQPDRENVG